ncbi:MAG: CoB--CoM heterodisulfide reductase iron-sulfur subunit B family protein [Treponemataceae bacterium]|nr:CoB--CoM heterodisulfide reductase iron-sulfur subunit B family protein [Treponemataceae bacterium]
MNYSYFPGCTLKNKAKDLDMYARSAAAALGFELNEIEEWQCCGGVYPMGTNEIASKLPSVRALAAARDAGTPLVTLCSACYNVIKQVNNDMQNDEIMILKANKYLAQDGIEYHGETKVLHFLEVLRDEIGWDKVKAAVKNPLTGKKIGAYYGCLLLRPGKVMEFDDPENPQILEDFIKALGATPVIYGQRNECCGAYAAFEDESIPVKRASSILANAQDMGADFLVTSCPLCRYNLIKNKGNSPLDVVYFTELLAEALGVKEGK